MKHYLFLKKVLFLFLILLSFDVSCQQIETVLRQSSTELSIIGTYTSVQWQISSDNLAWYNLPGETKSTYNYLATAPAYIRAKQIDATGTITYSTVHKFVFETKTYLKKVISSGGQGYAESNGQSANGITIREDRNMTTNNKLNLTAYSDNWTNGNASLVWYLYTSAGSYDLDLTFNIPSGVTQQFEFTITDINATGMIGNPIKSVVSVKGKGVNDSLTISTFVAPRLGFYRYELKPLVNPNSQIKIVRTWFKSYTSASADVHATNYLNPPSCHLGTWRTTDAAVRSGALADWVYEEVLVPTGGDAPSTYYMTLGVSAGYMGIQTNSPTIHGVIFSMWDNGSTETDPFLSESMKAGALDADPSATVKHFGGEGTGTQILLQNGWYWDVNKPVKFLSNARLEEFKDTLKSKLTGKDSIVVRKNTLVSAWFNSGKSWRYIGTLRRAFDMKYFNSWYSFIEGYGYQVGQFKRSAYYYNGFQHLAPTEPSKAGKWVHCNQVNYSNTDGAIGQRVDYEQKAQPADSPVPNAFYMSTGGYANAPVKTTNTILLSSDITVVDTLDLAAFSARVDKAILKEKVLKDSINNITNNKATKTGWTIQSYSSQETSGEGAINGRASCTIDGNTSTFWHSQWSGTTAGFPHSIVVDMHKTENVTGFSFTLSGGTTRHMKGIELWGSSDGITFELMRTINVPDLELLYVLLPKTWSISMFKLVIQNSQSGEAFCRINEIDITVAKTSTGVKPTFLSDKLTRNISVFPNPVYSDINLSLNTDALNAKVQILSLSGKMLFASKIGTLQAGQVCSFLMPVHGNGFYILQIESENKIVGAQPIYIANR